MKKHPSRSPPTPQPLARRRRRRELAQQIRPWELAPSKETNGVKTNGTAKPAAKTNGAAKAAAKAAAKG